MKLMQKTCTVNESVNTTNAVPPLTNKLCSISLEKRRCLIMSRDGTKLILDRKVITTCTLTEHVTVDRRAALKIYNTVTIKKLLPAQSRCPIFCTDYFESREI